MHPYDKFCSQIEHFSEAAFSEHEAEYSKGWDDGAAGRAAKPTDASRDSLLWAYEFGFRAGRAV